MAWRVCGLLFPHMLRAVDNAARSRPSPSPQTILQAIGFLLSVKTGDIA